MRLRQCTTMSIPLREVPNQGTVVFLFFSIYFGGRPQLVVELGNLCQFKNLYSAQLGMVVLRSVQGKTPQRQLRYTSYCCLWKCLHRKKSQLIEAVIHARPPHTRFLVGCSSPFIRFARHHTALRAWCKQCLPGR